MQMRRGLTLIEVVVAILVFAVGGLGLAASAATILRQLTETNLRSRAGSIARVRSETANASSCTALSSGEARSAGIRSVWLLNGTATLDHRVERIDHRGTHGDRFLTAVTCE